MGFKQLTKEEAKLKIKELVDEYTSKIKDREQSLDERNTERFIERILHILSWDIDNFDQVVRRDSVKIEDRRKIPDYVLYINGEKKAVVEAKAFSEPLDNPQYVKQALEYGYYKQVRVCILTNGKEIRVYDPFILSKSAEGKLLFSISINQYEDQFEQKLWFLSYNEIKENTILAKFATKGEVKKPVSEEVIDNIIKGRKLLIDSIMRLNKIEDFNLAREHAHKIINRFLFIRVAEDRGFFKEFNHGRILEDRVQIFKKRISQKIKPLMNEIKELFMEINEVYNGELFKPHPCEELKIDSDALEKVIYLMYYIKHENGEEDQVDFSKLDADVLGSIYEKFLGTIIHETKSGKLIEKVDNGVRKEMGQYYTPQYIVDFIVRNTIIPYLDENPDKLFSIKVVDPACGSGAFLIKAFDALYLKYSEFNKQQESKRKTKDLTGFLNDKSVARINEVILHKHIHGVDLDHEAVELAKINLWLRTIQEEMKLNELNKNIKQGNSLVSDKTIDTKNAFDWDKEFPYKFDIVIGNPPYMLLQPENTPRDLLDHFKQEYVIAQYKIDTYHLFFQKGISLLKEGGYFGFITPNTYLMNIYLSNLRKYILETCKIAKLVIIPKEVFEDASVDTAIIILQKESNKEKREKNNIQVLKIRDFIKGNHANTIVQQKSFQDADNFVFNVNISDEQDKLFNKIKKESVPLGTICRISFGLQTKDKKTYVKNYAQNTNWKPCIDGGNIYPYVIVFKEQYFLHDLKIKAGGCWDESTHNVPKKIVIRQIGATPIAAMDVNKYYSLNTIYNVTGLNGEYSYEYILALLNSKLIKFFWKKNFSDSKILFPKIKKAYLDKLPIKKITLLEQEKIISIVTDLMKLQRPYLSICSKVANSDASKKGYYNLVEEKTKLKNEMDKLELNLNNIIYEIYKLNKEDVAVIEENLK